MHLAQAVFDELERIALRNEVRKVGTVHLRILDADTHCLADCLKMLFAGSPAFQQASIRTSESPQDVGPDGARVIIERIEGEQD